MTPIRVQCFCVSLGAVVLAVLGSSQASFAQDDAEWIVRVYRVTDLILPRPDYPYDGSEIPTTGSSLGSSGPVFGTATVSGGSGGFGGGGTMGGGFGGGGSGFFQVTDGGGGLTAMDSQISGDEAGPRFSIEDLIHAIQSTIEPMSWDVMGGSAVCTPLGGMLIIKQTPPAHEQIDELLTAIRDEGSVGSVTLEAYWLLLGAGDLGQLVAEGNERVPARVNREMLEFLADANPGYQGRITCFSDQTVHLVSGQRRSTVLSVVPVVGADAIGLQPVISMPNIGVLLEVKPTLLPDEETAILNLVSTVTSTGSGTETFEMVSQASEESHTTLKLDRLNLDTQRLATTVRVPLGQPVLVGGLSVVGETPVNDQSHDGQLYLVVELTADAGEVNP